MKINKLDKILLIMTYFALDCTIVLAIGGFS